MSIDRLSGVLALCAAAPSAEGWSALAARVDALGALTPLELIRLEEQLAAWPDGLRPLSGAQARALSEGRSVASAPLCRVFALTELATSFCALGAYSHEEERMDTLDAAARALAEHPALGYLHLLHAEAYPSDPGLLLSSPRLRAVEELNLGTGAVEATLQTLLRAPCLGGLRRLSLSQPSTGAVQEATWLALVRHGGLERLEQLRIHGADRLGTGVVQAIVRERRLGQLETLHLGYGGVRAEGVRALAEASHLRRLVELQLDLSRPDPEALRALFFAPWLGPLQKLSLSACALGDDAAWLLGGAPSLCALTSLDLGHNALTAVGVELLLNAPIATELRALHLRNNALGDAGAHQLARSEHLGCLEVLNLRECGIGDRGLRALVETSQLPRLRVLNVMHNRCSPETAAALRGRFARVEGLPA